jgi:Uma2 family endonuclease
MLATAPQAETRTLLSYVSWQTFKTMLTEMGSERQNRIAYDSGMVEIMTPLMPHENSNRNIEGLILGLCEEFGLEVKSTGSLALTRDDIENIDLDREPPRDLVLEVEYSRPKIDKLSLYAALGIPEFWRYNGTLLRVYTLSGNKYTEVENSPTFTSVAVKDIPRFIQESKKIGQIAAKRNFRDWIKQQISAVPEK